MDEQSLSHTKWKCQYHIVIIPKYRRKVIYGKLRSDIGKILRRLCEYKHVEIIEAHAMPDHIHMLNQHDYRVDTRTSVVLAIQITYKVVNPIKIDCRINLSE